jgi:hypothetical protein
MRPRIRSYEEAALFLGDRNERDTGQRGTSVLRLTPTEIAVRYHNTDVVIYHHPVTGKVATIDSGGWSSPTTVSRINEYCPEGWTAEADTTGIWFGNPDGDGNWLDLSDPFTLKRNGNGGAP